MIEPEAPDPLLNPDIPQRIRKGKRGKALTVKTWELAERFYLAGTRQTKALADRIGCSPHTADKLINRGFPNLNRPALKDRAALYDRQQLATTERAAIDQMKNEANEYARTKRQNLDVARNVRAQATSLLISLHGRTTEQVNGQNVPRRNIATNELRMLSRSLKDISATLKETGEAEMRWISGAAPEEPQGDGLQDLTVEQLEYITRTGMLPAGVTAEQLTAASLRTIGTMKPPGP